MYGGSRREARPATRRAEGSIFHRAQDKLNIVSEMFSTYIADIDSEVRKLTNLQNSNSPSTESDMSDSMESLIGSQSQGTRDTLPNEQVIHYPLFTNNNNIIFRGSEIYYQHGNRWTSIDISFLFYLSGGIKIIILIYLNQFRNLRLRSLSISFVTVILSEEITNSNRPWHHCLWKIFFDLNNFENS